MTWVFAALRVGCLLPINFLCLFFLLVRWGILKRLLNYVLGTLRCWEGWGGAGTEDTAASEYLLNVRYVVAKGWQRQVRCAMTALLAGASALTAALFPWGCPCLVLFCVLSDITVLLFSAPPMASYKWVRDRHGLEVGVQQPSPYKKHVAITGGVSLAAYTTGVLHAMFTRYGTDAFKDCDFAGASSGCWTAACGVLVANGCRDAYQVFELIFVAACQLCELYPMGLVFVGCEAVEEVTSWAVHIAEQECKSAARAVTAEGKLVIWLFGCSLRRLWSSASGSAYRLVVREGPDLQSDRVGRLCSATSTFPYFTHPGLHSRLACAPAAMDGWFPGKGSGIMPVPDLAVPAQGNTLLFDISGDLRETYKHEERVWVLSLREWRDFAVQDWAASSPEAFRRLFAAGMRDASARWPELDRVMEEAFGARPLPKQKVADPS